MLTLDCPHCGNSFAAAIQDRRTFDAMRVESMIERCPSCEHASRFKKAEYRYIADEGPDPPARMSDPAIPAQVTTGRRAARHPIPPLHTLGPSSRGG